MDCNELFLLVSNGNKAAETFLHEITEVAHFWDDLIDRDQHLTAAEIHSNFEKALITLPINPFYRSNEQLLRPIMLMSIMNWKAANVLEHEQQDNDLQIAFILRSAYADIISMTAMICHGFESAQSLILAIRRKCHSEGFVNYLENLKTEKAHGHV